MRDVNYEFDIRTEYSYGNCGRAATPGIYRRRGLLSRLYCRSMTSTTVRNDLSRDFRRSVGLAARGIAGDDAAAANVISPNSK